MKDTIVNVISLYKEGKRLTNFLNLINILQSKGYRISVVLQNYPQEIIDVLKSRNIDVLTCKAKNPATARNTFLKKYYESDYSFFIMMDDDVVLDTKVLTKEQDTLKYLIDNIRKSKENVAIISLEMNDFVYRYNNKLPDKKLDFWATAFAMKNLNKKNNIKLYFDEEYFALEERKFAVDLFNLNLFVEWHYDATFKQLFNYSTYGNKLQRKEVFRKSRIQLAKNNPDIFKITKDYKLTYHKNIKEKLQHAVEKNSSFQR